MNKKKQARPMTAREWAIMLLLASIWGCSFIFMEISLDGFASFQLAFLRVLTGTLTLGVIILFFLKDPFANITKQLPFLAILALFTSAAPFAMITWGQTHITASLASIINASTPLTGILLAHFFTSDEKLSGRRMLGVLIGFCGVVSLIGPAALNGLNDNFWGIIAVFCATICYAIAGILGKKVKNISPIVTAFFSLGFSSLWLLPTMLIMNGFPLENITLYPILSLLGLGIMSTGFAYILYFKLLSTAGASNIFIVTLLAPASAMLFGSFFLGETISANALLGFLFIIIGMLILDGRVIKLFKR